MDLNCAVSMVYQPSHWLAKRFCFGFWLIYAKIVHIPVFCSPEKIFPQHTKSKRYGFCSLFFWHRAYTFIMVHSHPVVSPVQFVADAIVRVLRAGFIFDFYISWEWNMHDRWICFGFADDFLDVSVCSFSWLMSCHIHSVSLRTIYIWLWKRSPRCALPNV